MKKKTSFFLFFVFFNTFSFFGGSSTRPKDTSPPPQFLEKSSSPETSSPPSSENSRNDQDISSDEKKQNNLPPEEKSETISSEKSPQLKAPEKKAFFIKDISLSGQQCITLEDVLKFFPSSPRERFYTPEMLNEILKNIHERQWFSKISFDLQKNVLRIQVKENKFLNEIIFEGCDNKEDLQRLLKPIFRPYQNIDEEQIQQGKKVILDFLKERGKLASTVMVHSVPRHGGRVDLVFTIQGGDKIYIRELQFVGNKHFSHKELMAFVKSRVAGFWRFQFPPEELYNERRLHAEDTQQLLNFYKSRGYLDVTIDVSAVFNQRRNGALVTFTIHEGMRYDFATTKVVSHVAGINPQDVEKFITWKAGDCFNAMMIKNLDEFLSSRWSGEGRPFLNIVPDFRRELSQDGKNPKVHVTLNVRQMPRSFVGNIFLSGNRRTKDYVIHNMITFAPGDPLTPNAMRRSYQQLQASDFFNSAEIIDSATDFPDRRDITIKVREKATCSPMIQGFFTGTKNQKDYGFMAQVGDTNFLGRAWPAQIMLAVKRRGFDLGGSLTVPGILDRQLDWNTNVNISLYKAYINNQTKKEREKSQEEEEKKNFLKNLKEQELKDLQDNDNEQDKGQDKNDKDEIYDPSDPQYREYSVGLSSTFVFPISARFSEEVGISLAKSQTKVSKGTSQYIQDNIAENPSIEAAGIIHRLNYSRRLSPKNFFSNFFTSWRFNIMGGTVGYVTNSLTLGATAGFGPKKSYVLRLSATYGELTPFGYMRFNNQFTLGDGTFLGFNPSGIGPRDANKKDALGGQQYYAAFARIYIPLDISENLPMKGVLFFQSGSIWNSIFDGEDVLGNDFSNRSAIGAGVSIVLPFVNGPIFLGYSKSLQAEEFDSPSGFVFVMGSI